MRPLISVVKKELVVLHYTTFFFFDSLSCSFFIQSEGHEVTTHQIDYKTREGIIPNDSNVRVPSEA
jgi:hypothetical protein